MRVVNKKLWAEFRTAGRCEWCLRLCDRREPAHLFSRGSGGPDFRCNLVALGQTRTWQCRCHRLSHAGKSPTQAELLAIAAKREGCLVQDIIDVVCLIRLLPRGLSQARMQVEIAGLGREAAELAARELVGAGVLLEP